MMFFPPVLELLPVAVAHPGAPLLEMVPGGRIHFHPECIKKVSRRSERYERDVLDVVQQLLVRGALVLV